MSLTEFIHANHKSIIEDWVSFAGTLSPWSNGMSEEKLRDHAEELLTAVVNDMKSPQTLGQQAEKSKGNTGEGELAKIGQKHASDRLESGQNLDQLVSEFRALRASVLRQWEKTQSDEFKEITRFNEAIDETLVKSTARYSEILSTTREQFLGVLGHDLRNPIGSIIMGANLLLDSDHPENVEVAQSILNSGERMSRMVNDLLDLTRSRLGSGIPVVLKPMDLSLMCSRVISELRIMHPKSQIQFHSPGPVQGEWDNDRLSQALSNLISNAIQYGKRGSPIVILLDSKGSVIHLTVHNEGEKISETAMKTIFAPMSRVRPQSEAVDSNVTGLGLGLYIASEIVLAHQGKIAVTSDERSGTSFAIELPQYPVPPASSDKPSHANPPSRLS